MRIGRSAVGGPPADILFVFGKGLIFGQGIQRVAVAVALIRIAGCGEVGKGGDADECAWQADPEITRAQAAREQKVGAEAVSDGSERSILRQLLYERAVGAEAFVVHGGIDALFARLIVDAVYACAHLGISLGGAPVKVV